MLLDVPPTRPSKHAMLKAFMKKHNIHTHYCREMEHWKRLAILLKPGEKRSFVEVIAEECRRYEEAGRIYEADGEMSAVRGLCEHNGIPFKL